MRAGSTYLDHLGAHALGLARHIVHVLLQVQVQELEHQVQARVLVDDLEEAHDIVVSQLLEQADLPDCRARHALVLGLEADLFERDDPPVGPRAQIPRLVYDTVCPCPCKPAARRYPARGHVPSPTFSIRW